MWSKGEFFEFTVGIIRGKLLFILLNLKYRSLHLLLKWGRIFYFLPIFFILLENLVIL